MGFLDALALAVLFAAFLFNAIVIISSGRF